MFEKIKKLTYEQLDVIVKARRAVPLAGFLSVNGKARNAAIQRHKGWQEELIKYVNAIIEASVRAKVNNALSTAALISAVESMGLGIITKEDLTLEEYDLIISPMIGAFPELIVLTQDWTPIPLDESQRFRPSQPYMLPPEATRTEATMPKKGRTFRRTEDVVEDQFAKEESDSFLEALKPKTVTPAISKDEAIQKMLDAMKPTVKTVTTTSETTPVVPSFATAGPSITSIEFIQTSKMPKYLHLQPSTEGDGFRLIDFETAIYWGPVFKTAIDGIVWAAKEGIKIK